MGSFYDTDTTKSVHPKEWPTTDTDVRTAVHPKEWQPTDNDVVASVYPKEWSQTNSNNFGSGPDNPTWTNVGKLSPKLRLNPSGIDNIFRHLLDVEMAKSF